jgi:hypothetical protein
MIATRCSGPFEANPGDKASALELAGASAFPSQSPAPEGLRKSPSPSSAADRADQFAIDIATLRGRAKPEVGQKPALTHVPEKTIELGL